MPEKAEIRTPDLGDFENVPVIEIFVGVGDVIEPDDPLVAIESDKATMEIPADTAGTVRDIRVSIGDEVSTGQVLLIVDVADPQMPSRPAPATPEPASEDPAAGNRGPAPVSAGPTSAVTGKTRPARLVVLGSGPGGYTAAFRAADLGMEVVLVERYPRLGGVCLNVGCIPSKALLHLARIISESREAREIGLSYPEPVIDIPQALAWKSGIVSRLTTGLAGLAEKRKVTVIQGVGAFASEHRIEVTAQNGTEHLSFDQAIIATGSEPIQIPGFPHDDPRVIDSTGALELDDIPERLLIVGGGIIGLEMATVYEALGSKVSVVEMMDSLMAGADPDLVRPLFKRIRRQYENIWLGTQVTEMAARENGIEVHFAGGNPPDRLVFDKVLVAVGRTPNGHKINARAAGVRVSEKGFIPVNAQQQTSVPHIYAIGDIVGQPMLAHKAVHEGKVAAEVASGLKSGFDARVIPSVAYTDPEVAWAGVTETEAKANGVNYGKGTFPWAASGRSLSQGRNEGLTKLLFDKETGRIIGAGIVGPNAGELIAEAALAIEMNADAQDIGLTIHAHPTLSETLGFAAEAFEGTITDLYLPRK